MRSKKTGLNLVWTRMNLLNNRPYRSIIERSKEWRVELDLVLSMIKTLIRKRKEKLQYFKWSTRQESKTSIMKRAKPVSIYFKDKNSRYLTYLVVISWIRPLTISENLRKIINCQVISQSGWKMSRRNKRKLWCLSLFKIEKHTTQSLWSLLRQKQGLTSNRSKLWQRLTSALDLKK